MDLAYTGHPLPDLPRSTKRCICSDKRPRINLDKNTSPNIIFESEMVLVAGFHMELFVEASV